VFHTRTAVTRLAAGSRLAVPPLDATLVWWLLFAVGTALAFCAMLSGLGPLGVAVATAGLTAIAVVARSPRRSPPLRLAAWGILTGVHLFWLALLTALLAVLAWSVPAWIWVAAGTCLLLVVLTRLMDVGGVRVPLALPLGIMIAALAYGWMREDGRIRCDDYLRVRAAGLAVVVPSSPELTSCVPGEALTVVRYPRLMWEDPSGGRFLISTQRGDHRYSPPVPAGRPVASWLDGAICEAPAAGGAPRCIGDGKADAFVESRAHDRLFTTAHDAASTTIYVLPRSGPLRVLASTEVPLRAGILYLDDQSDVLGLCEDESTQIHQFGLSDLRERATVAAPVTSTFIRYDGERHEGVACGAGRTAGTAFAAAAFRGDPFTFRFLAPASEHPSSWLAVTWGCDWDPRRRRVYVAVASIGLLEVIDYDTGRILASRFVGMGIRPVAYDAERRLIYVGTFLSGDVLALDADTLAPVDRWFVGRFLRQLELSRDRQALLATSTLGIIRIPLPPPAGGQPAAGRATTRGA
jgi:hypothetical protein